MLRNPLPTAYVTMRNYRLAGISHFDMSISGSLMIGLMRPGIAIDLAASIIFLALGLTGSKFYKPFRRGEHTPDDEVPTWLGRTLFIIGGLWFAWAALDSLRVR